MDNSLSYSLPSSPPTDTPYFASPRRTQRKHSSSFSTPRNSAQPQKCYTDLNFRHSKNPISPTAQKTFKSVQAMKTKLENGKSSYILTKQPEPEPISPEDFEQLQNNYVKLYNTNRYTMIRLQEALKRLDLIEVDYSGALDKISILETAVERASSARKYNNNRLYNLSPDKSQANLEHEHSHSDQTKAETNYSNNTRHRTNLHQIKDNYLQSCKEYRKYKKSSNSDLQLVIPFKNYSHSFATTARILPRNNILDQDQYKGYQPTPNSITSSFSVPAQSSLNHYSNAQCLLQFPKPKPKPKPRLKPKAQKQAQIEPVLEKLSYTDISDNDGCYFKAFHKDVSTQFLQINFDSTDHLNSKTRIYKDRPQSTSKFTISAVSTVNSFRPLSCNFLNQHIKDEQKQKRKEIQIQIKPRVSQEASKLPVFCKNTKAKARLSRRILDSYKTRDFRNSYRYTRNQAPRGLFGYPIFMHRTVACMVRKHCTIAQAVMRHFIQQYRLNKRWILHQKLILDINYNQESSQLQTRNTRPAPLLIKLNTSEYRLILIKYNKRTGIPGVKRRIFIRNKLLFFGNRSKNIFSQSLDPTPISSPESASNCGTGSKSISSLELDFKSNSNPHPAFDTPPNQILYLYYPPNPNVVDLDLKNDSDQVLRIAFKAENVIYPVSSLVSKVKSSLGFLYTILGSNSLKRKEQNKARLN